MHIADEDSNRRRFLSSALPVCRAPF